MAVTAHYISSPKERPQEWSLESRMLGYAEIEGSHSGANEAAIIMRVIDRYDIRDKVWITTTPTRYYILIILHPSLRSGGRRPTMLPLMIEHVVSYSVFSTIRRTAVELGTHGSAVYDVLNIPFI